MASNLFDPAFLRRLEELSIASRRINTGHVKGERRTTRKGTGLEFTDYRPYVVGDDLRYVDWNIYSRLDKLLLKLYVEEEDMCLHLLVDSSASMGFGDPTKLDYALRLAGALGFIALTNLERVAVGSCSGAALQGLRPLRGRSQIIPVLKFLESLAPQGGTGLNEALTAYAVRARSAGVAVVLTDLLDAGGYAEGLRALIQRQFEVLLLHVVAEEELSPRLIGDLVLVDAEGGTSRQVSIDKTVLDEYQRRLEVHCAEAERFCLRHGIDYLRTSTAMPFEDVVLRHLRRGGFLR